MAKNMRVHELARQLGLSDAQMLGLCDAMGVGVKSASSTLIEAQADRLRRRAIRDGLTDFRLEPVVSQVSGPRVMPAVSPRRFGRRASAATSSRINDRAQQSAAESITAEQLARLMRVDLALLLKTCRENGIGAAGPRSLLSAQDRVATERLLARHSQTNGQSGEGASAPEGRDASSEPVNLSRQLQSSIWSTLEKAAGTPTVFAGPVTEVVNGGMIVDLGVRAFLPGSQVDRRSVSTPQDWLGKHVEVEVLEADAARSRLVVSRRTLLERRAKLAADAFYESAELGELREAQVLAVQDRGVLFDVTGVEVFIKDRELGKSSREHTEGESVLVAICDLDRQLRTVVASTRFQVPTAQTPNEAPLELPDAAAAGVHAVDGRLIVDISAVEDGALDRVLVEAAGRGHTSVLVVLAGESDGSKRILRHAIKAGVFSGVDPTRCRQTSDGFSVALRVVPRSAQQSDDRDGWSRQVG